LHFYLAVQVMYGFYMAGEVAYFTYMYAKVEREKYQKVTGNARASQQVGRFVASVMAQILISSEAMDVRELNYITFGSELHLFEI
jgi:thiamine transporter 2/3